VGVLFLRGIVSRKVREERYGGNMEWILWMCLWPLTAAVIEYLDGLKKRLAPGIIVNPREKRLERRASAAWGFIVLVIWVMGAIKFA
jgi:hypothetical protein